MIILVLVYLSLLSPATNAHPILEYSAQHESPVLQYSRLDLWSDCSSRDFDFEEPLLSGGGRIVLLRRFPAGGKFKFRVVGQNTQSRSVCVLVGEVGFYYLGTEDFLSQ